MRQKRSDGVAESPGLQLRLWASQAAFFRLPGDRCVLPLYKLAVREIVRGKAAIARKLKGKWQWWKHEEEEKMGRGSRRKRYWGENWEKAKVTVKCLIKGWRLQDDCFWTKDLQRQDVRWRQRWLGFNYGQRKPHSHGYQISILEWIFCTVNNKRY